MEKARGFENEAWNPGKQVAQTTVAGCSLFFRSPEVAQFMRKLVTVIEERRGEQAIEQLSFSSQQALCFVIVLEKLSPVP